MHGPQGVRRSKAGKPFAEPVPLDEVPGYAAVVSHPMDLGTIIEGLFAGRYSSPGNLFWRGTAQQGSYRLHACRCRHIQLGLLQTCLGLGCTELSHLIGVALLCVLWVPQLRVVKCRTQSPVPESLSAQPYIADSTAHGAEAVAADVALVWHNCQQYNQPGSAIDQLRVKAQQAFEQAWARAQLPFSSGPPSGTALTASQPKASRKACCSG